MDRKDNPQAKGSTDKSFIVFLERLTFLAFHSMTVYKRGQQSLLVLLCGKKNPKAKFTFTGRIVLLGESQERYPCHGEPAGAAGATQGRGAPHLQDARVRAEASLAPGYLWLPVDVGLENDKLEEKFRLLNPTSSTHGLSSYVEARLFYFTCFCLSASASTFRM